MTEEVAAFDNVDAHFLGTLYTVAALDGMTRAHICMRVCLCSGKVVCLHVPQYCLHVRGRLARCVHAA
jgi:hypothetical protein